MNAPVPSNRHRPGILMTWAAVAALALCLLLAGYLALPALVNRMLSAERFRGLGVSDFKGRIATIGPFRTTAGPFVFGPADHPALAIHCVTLNYTPVGLARKTIRCMRINGVVINAALGPDGFSFPGVDLETLAGAGKSEPPSAHGPALPSDGLGRLEIRGGMFNLRRGALIDKIPFEADLMPPGPDKAIRHIQLRFFPRDQVVALTLRADLEKRAGQARLDAPEVGLDRFADLMRLIPGLTARGRLAVRADARLKWSPLSIFDAHVDLNWPEGRVALDKVVLEPGPDGMPATLSVLSEDLKTWRIRAGGMHLLAPQPASLNQLTASVDIDQATLNAAGMAEWTLLPFSLEQPVPVALEAGVSLALNVDIHRQVAGDWRAMLDMGATANGAAPTPLALNIAGTRIHAEVPRFNLTAEGAGQEGKLNWDLDIGTIQTALAGLRIDSSSTHAGGQLQLTQTPDGPLWNGDGQIAFPRLTLQGRDMGGGLGPLTVSGRYNQQGSHEPVMDARLQFSDGRFEHRPSGLRLTGGRLDFPLRANPGDKGAKGTFSVARIALGQRVLGKIQGRLTQQKDAIAFTATPVSELLPGMRAALSGTVETHGKGRGNAALALDLAPYELPAENDLGRLLPAARGVILTGTLAAQGRASLSGRGPAGFLDVAMTNGGLAVPAKKITLQGINTTLRFPELPRIRSAPAQQIRFSRAAMGGIVMDGGSFDFQVEADNTLLVEKGRLAWCGGKVDVQSLRITTGKQDYLVSLYCQRLGLSRILEQLGTVNAKGTGTVNGRIPIAYDRGKIRFDDGFLFSTPGESGRIQLTNTDVLTRGIPVDSPQLVQVALAQEALKDYDYTWAKLGLTSEGEDLVMRLQFDGKPAKPLPFVYKKELGGFVRVAVDSQGSLFQGIGLDVNLKLPLNRLLQYKEIVNLIE